MLETIQMMLLFTQAKDLMKSLKVIFISKSSQTLKMELLSLRSLWTSFTSSIYWELIEQQQHMGLRLENLSLTKHSYNITLTYLPMLNVQETASKSIISEKLLEILSQGFYQMRFYGDKRKLLVMVLAAW